MLKAWCHLSEHKSWKIFASEDLALLFKSAGPSASSILTISAPSGSSLKKVLNSFLYRVFHLLGTRGLTWFLRVPLPAPFCLAWCEFGCATVQEGGTFKSNSTQPRCTSTWNTMYKPCNWLQRQPICFIITWGHSDISHRRRRRYHPDGPTAVGISPWPSPCDAPPSPSPWPPFWRPSSVVFALASRPNPGKSYT